MRIYYKRIMSEQLRTPARTRAAPSARAAPPRRLQRSRSRSPGPRPRSPVKPLHCRGTQSPIFTPTPRRPIYKCSGSPSCQFRVVRWERIPRPKYVSPPSWMKKAQEELAAQQEPVPGQDKTPQPTQIDVDPAVLFGTLGGSPVKPSPPRQESPPPTPRVQRAIFCGTCGTAHRYWAFPEAKVKPCQLPFLQLRKCLWCGATKHLSNRELLLESTTDWFSDSE